MTRADDAVVELLQCCGVGGEEEVRFVVEAPEVAGGGAEGGEASEVNALRHGEGDGEIGGVEEGGMMGRS